MPPSILRMEGEKSRLSGQHSHFQSEKSLENMISILVVDDDTTCLSIVAALLKKWKYQVMTVKHPMDALCTLRIKGVRFDLVVSDVHLPDMDGFELQQQIHQEFKIPVVLMSVDNEEGVIVKGIESGAAFFIVKPISSEDLKDLWQFAASSGKKLGGKATIIKEIANGDSQSKTDYKRKSSSNVYDTKRNYNVTTLKKTKMTWTNALHNRFLEAIRSLGSEKAVPKNILELMKVPGLTREHVASHLQKYRIFLRQVASCNAQCPDSAGMNFQSSFVSGNPNALMLNSLLQQQMRSSSLHQRLGGLNNIPVFNSSKFSSMSFLNQEAPINRSTPPSSGYQKSCLLCNQGIPSGLMGGTNSNLMYQPLTQAVQNFQTNGLTNYGSPTFGIRGNIPAANEIIGTSSISGPIQNLSNFNSNYICHQTPAEQFCTGNEGQIDHTYDIVNNPSIVDNYFRQQSSGLGDLSSSFFNGINTQYLTDQVQNEQENANLDTSVGSNHVGDTIMMNGQPSDKPFSGEEVLLTNSSFGNDGIQSDDLFSWFDQDQIHSQQYYHEGIMSYSMDNIDDTSKFNDKSYPSIS